MQTGADPLSKAPTGTLKHAMNCTLIYRHLLTKKKKNVVSSFKLAVNLNIPVLKPQVRASVPILSGHEDRHSSRNIVPELSRPRVRAGFAARPAVLELSRPRVRAGFTVG